MNYKEIAIKIIELVGNSENVTSAMHCATRLRIFVKDRSLVNIDAIEKIDGVKGVMFRTDQLQIVLGSGVVNKVFAEVNLLLDNKDDMDDNPKKAFSIGNVLANFMDALSSIFAPIIPILVGTGTLMGILYILPQYGILDKTSAYFTVLNAFANASFYFLPIYLGFSSAKRFGCNQYLGALLGAILVHPSIIAIATSENNILNLFGLDVSIYNYSSSVIPVILSVYFMSKVERILKKVIPDIIDIMVVPIITIVISGLVALIVFAPLGMLIGKFVADALMTVYNFSGPLGGFLFSATRPFVLATGMNVAIVPLSVLNIELLGYDFIFPLSAASNAAMATAAFYVFLKAKDQKTKSLAASSAFSGYIGVTEPALFGFVLKYRNALIATIIGGGVGGAIMGFFKVQFAGMGLVPFGGILLAVGPTFIYYLIGVFSSIIVTFLVLMYLGVKEVGVEEESGIVISNPVSGKIVELSEVGDPTFSKGLVGKGIAIVPDNDVIVAPVNGKIITVFPTKHAIGIESDDGIEILIHVGVDTVKMGGAGFESFVNEGDIISVGEKLLTFDSELIKEQGYDNMVCMVITNDKDVTFAKQFKYNDIVMAAKPILDIYGVHNEK